MLGKTQHCVFMDYRRTRLAPLNIRVAAALLMICKFVGTLECIQFNSAQFSGET